jgi:hypothetical protein
MSSADRVRTFAGACWLALVAVAVVAPPARSGVGSWIGSMLIGAIDSLEPWTVAAFYAMGLWPLVLAGLLRDELRARPVPAWPFLLGGMVIGGFGFLPWLVVSGDAPEDRRPLERFGGVGDPLWGAVLAAGFAGLAAWGLLAGDPIGFLAEVRQEGFMFVMMADFTALWLASVVLAYRRSRSGAWLLALLPGIGAGLWMATGRR